MNDNVLYRNLTLHQASRPRSAHVLQEPVLRVVSGISAGTYSARHNELAKTLPTIFHALNWGYRSHHTLRLPRRREMEDDGKN